WVGAHCRQVWIDVSLGLDAPEAARSRVPDHELLGARHYRNTAEFAEELPQASEALAQTTRAATWLIDEAAAGNKLGAAEVREAVEPVVQSILRNSDTLFWVNTLRASAGYAYSHAINCSMLAAAFGRHLGLPSELLVDLAGGGLLLDIGKTRLPQALVTRAGPLSRQEMLQVREHVLHGAGMLEA